MKLAHFLAWAETFVMQGFENVLVKSKKTIKVEYL